MKSANYLLWSAIAVACAVPPAWAAGKGEDAELRGLRAAVQPSDFVQSSERELRLDGRPLRLWGLALRGSPPLTRPIPDDAEPESDPAASAFLRRMEALGIGLLRLDIPHAEADDEAARSRAIDRVLARSRAHGIYVWLGASHALGSVSPDDVVVLDDAGSAEAWSAAVADRPGGRLLLDGCLARAWDPRLELLETQRLVERSSHFNPVSGRRWSEDPAVALWELEGPDGWHARMKAGEDRTFPDISRSFLAIQFDGWLYNRYGDKEPDPLPPEDRAAFLNDLWTGHKRRVAGKFRLGGAGIHQCALAWRETVEPEAPGDASGCFALYARPEAVAGTAVPEDDLAVLRIHSPETDRGEPLPPDEPWRVLAASGRFAAVAWDADLPTNAAPTAFQVAFAAAGDVFRAGVRDFSSKPGADEGTWRSWTHPAFTWRQAEAERALALDDGPDAPQLALPGEAAAMAAAIVRCVPERRTVYVAVEPAGDAVLALPATAADADRFWGRLPVAYTVCDVSGDEIGGGSVETLPQRIPLPAGTFRVDFSR